MERITITVKEAADFLGVSKDLLYNLVRTKEIPHVRVGKRILFRKPMLEEWLEAQEKQSTVKVEVGLKEFF